MFALIIIQPIENSGTYFPQTRAEYGSRLL